MKTAFGRSVVACVFLVLVAVSSVSAAEQGFKPIFDGKTLDGWKKLGGKAKYRVEDGAIVGTSVPNSPNTFLCSKHMYSDFILKLEVKLVSNSLNSGIQIRSNSYPEYRKGRVHGYQVEIESSPGESGYIYDEARRGWLSKDRSENKRAFKNGKWNEYRIECRGNRIKTYINGTQIADVTDDMTAAGFIGLQVHGVGGREEPLEVRWRNIRIKRLDRNRWEDLFNGRNLDGWKNPYDWGEATVEDGEIHLTGDKMFFLTHEERYGDFVFESEVKLPDRESNSGLQFRSHPEKNDIQGPQVEIAANAAGTLYDMTIHAHHNNIEDKPSAKLAYEPGEWNVFRVECEGDHIQIFVNGVRITNLRHAGSLHRASELAGHFALQHHGEEGKTYRFRNIRVKDRGKHVWKPLFNRENLDGWHEHPGGEWKVEDHVIVGSCTEESESYGLLISDKEYSDFVARMKFLKPVGDSGFYWRAKEIPGRVGIEGFQAEVEKAGQVGGLYESGGRGWVVKPPADVVKMAYKEGDWNQMTVSAHGDHVVVHLNGYKTAELTKDVRHEKGHLVLQLHAGMVTKVRFKDIEILQKAE